MKIGYPTDLTDEEWSIIYRYFPRTKKQGRPPEHLKRAIVNAILYIIRGGCAWRLLPNDFPPAKTVYHYFRIWKKNGFWKKLHDKLRKQTRIKAGRDPEPTAGIIDSQSVKTTDVAGEKGYDGGKKIKGRRRHIIVDVLGLIIITTVTAASVQERSQAKLMFTKIKEFMPRLEKIWADGGYTGPLIKWVNETCFFQNISPLSNTKKLYYR